MKDGGPAFPRPLSHSQGEVSPDQDGMTLRAYFIAHAPEKPWSWFKPNLSTEKPKFPEEKVLFEGLSEEQIMNFKVWRYDPCYELQKESPEFKNAIELIDQHHKAAEDWEKEYLQQKDIQWPAFWAEQMLKNLEGK